MFLTTHRLSRVMDEAFGVNGNGLAPWAPSTDIVEDQDAVRLVLDLPGVRPEDVKITVENQVLTIRGEKKTVTEEAKERWHRYERSTGSFARSFTLPASVDAGRIAASAQHGVLTLTLPKAERAKLREIPVQTA